MQFLSIKIDYSSRHYNFDRPPSISYITKHFQQSFQQKILLRTLKPGFNLKPFFRISVRFSV